MSEPEVTNSHMSIPANPQQEFLDQLQGQIERLEKRMNSYELRIKILEDFVIVCVFQWKLKTQNKHYKFNFCIMFKSRTFEYVAFCKEFPSLSYYGKDTFTVRRKIQILVEDIVTDLESTGEIVPQ